jgi:hypothetical protein
MIFRQINKIDDTYGCILNGRLAARHCEPQGEAIWDYSTPLRHCEDVSLKQSRNVLRLFSGLLRLRLAMTQ